MTSVKAERPRAGQNLPVTAHLAIALALALLLAACASLPGGEEEGLRAAGWPRVEPRPTRASDWPTEEFPKARFEYRSIEAGEAMSGGPPRDGIPALTAPAFASPEDAARWLGDAEPVAVVAGGGEAKAYPYRILTYHEIVNDVVGGVPVAVTWCPLCNSGLAFDRRLAGTTLEFGVSGRLRKSNMVMYDRQTESWFQQIDGQALAGILTGAVLERVGMTVLSFADAREAWPGLVVLDQERTGHQRSYGRNPYTRYDAEENFPFLLGPGEFRVGSGLSPMARVVVFEEPDAEGLPVVPLVDLEEAGVIRVGPYLVAAAGSHASPLDTQEVAGGREVPQATVWFAPGGGRWTLADGAMVGPDGSRHDPVSGRPLDVGGEALRPARHSVHFWFAWSVFDLDAEIWAP